jgi:hypothetical protein
MLLLVAWPCLAQNSDVPSRNEISELVQKANEKVTGFEQAIRLAKPFISAGAFSKDSDAASTAHLIIGVLEKNGPSAYGLVSLIITLDDLVINAGLNSQTILEGALKADSAGKPANLDMLSVVIALNSTATACLDISELIGHSTLRLISGEEKALEQTMK